MYKKTELKMLALETCAVMDVPKNEKIKIMKFIKEKADSEQCMGYILDGKMYNLNDDMKDNIKERFLKEQGYHPYRKTFFAHYGGPTGAAVSGAATGAQIAKAGGGAKAAIVGGAAGAALGLTQWAGYRLIRSAFDECTKKCGMFKINNPKRQMCLFKCKAARLEKEIAGLRKIGGSQEEISKKSAKLAQVKHTINRYEAKFKD